MLLFIQDSFVFCGMKKIVALYSLLLILLLAACASGPQTFSSEAKNGVDFKKYKTYAFLPTKDTAYAKVIDRKELVASLTEQAFRVLGEKGMVYDTANPDCLFRYHLVLKKEYETQRDQQISYSPYIETLNTPNQPKIYYFSSDNRPEVYNGNAQLGTFRNGTMVIDMIDRTSNEVVWRSTATSRKAEADVRDLKETVLIALPNMFHKFPVKIKK
jgi:Domain of unknown function (DUF4136)